MLKQYFMYIIIFCMLVYFSQENPNKNNTVAVIHASVVNMDTEFAHKMEYHMLSLISANTEYLHDSRKH